MSVGKSIRFLHLQKTGGSTLSIILRRQYFLRPTFYLGIPQDEVKLNVYLSSGRIRPALFLGHKDFSIGIEAVDNAQKITLLREPINRVLSLCQHVYEGKECYMLNNFPPGSFDLDRFLSMGYGELFNLQTRSLLSQHGCSYEDLLTQESPENIVDLAFQTLLTKVTAFGLTEYFDESLMVFASKLNWRLPPVYVQRNQGDRRHSLAYDQRHIDRISEMNHLDLMLYERARKYFIEALESPLLNLEKLQNFRQLNETYQRLVKKMPPPEALPYPFKLIIKALR